MARKDMKRALGASIRAEEDAFKSRFEKAESALGRNQSASKSQGKENGAGKAEKVIRDSFTMPSSDYDLITTVRQRCLKQGISINKSEVLRAGLQALNTMPEKQLRDVVNKLSKVKPGRPAGK
jgi:hypothetical protein